MDACKAAGVKLIVHSSLESYGSRLAIPHFDAKAEGESSPVPAKPVTKYIRAQGVPATILFTSYYFTNLNSAKLEERGGETVLELPLPDDTVLPGFNPHQIGLFARVAFAEPEEWTGNPPRPRSADRKARTCTRAARTCVSTRLRVFSPSFLAAPTRPWA